MIVPRLLQAVLLLALVPATAYAAIAASHSHDAVGSASSTKLTSLSISASGTAAKIGNATEPPTPEHSMMPLVITEPRVLVEPQSTLVAGLSIVSTIVHVTDGVITFNVTGTSLTIETNTYTISNGTGIFNQHSLVVVVHATVNVGGTPVTLVLIGQAQSARSTPGQVSVAFAAPQSKLAGRFFLNLKGMLTIA